MLACGTTPSVACSPTLPACLPSVNNQPLKPLGYVLYDNVFEWQTSPYERVDLAERAYQKLERAYTAKTELAAAAAAGGPRGSKSKDKREATVAVEGGERGAAADGDGARKKGKAGRWFD